MTYTPRYLALWLLLCGPALCASAESAKPDSKFADSMILCNSQALFITCIPKAHRWQECPSLLITESWPTSPQEKPMWMHAWKKENQRRGHEANRGRTQHPAFRGFIGGRTRKPYDSRVVKDHYGVQPAGFWRTRHAESKIDSHQMLVMCRYEVGVVSGMGIWPLVD